MRCVVITEQMPDGSESKICGFLVDTNEKGLVISSGLNQKRFPRITVSSNRILRVDDLADPPRASQSAAVKARQTVRM